MKWSEFDFVYSFIRDSPDDAVSEENCRSSLFLSDELCLHWYPLTYAHWWLGLAPLYCVLHCKYHWDAPGFPRTFFLSWTGIDAFHLSNRQKKVRMLFRLNLSSCITVSGNGKKWKFRADTKSKTPQECDQLTVQRYRSDWSGSWWLGRLVRIPTGSLSL